MGKRGRPRIEYPPSYPGIRGTDKLLSTGQRHFSFRIFTPGHPRGAEEVAQRVLIAQLRILGAQHADTLATLQYLGIARWSPVVATTKAKSCSLPPLKTGANMPGGDPGMPDTTSSVWRR